MDLASEEIGFFALPKADQLRYVERFVRLSLRAARDITVTSPPEEVVVAEDGHVDDDEME